MGPRWGLGKVLSGWRLATSAGGAPVDPIVERARRVAETARTAQAAPEPPEVLARARLSQGVRPLRDRRARRFPLPQRQWSPGAK